MRVCPSIESPWDSAVIKEQREVNSQLVTLNHELKQIAGLKEEMDISREEREKLTNDVAALQKELATLGIENELLRKKIKEDKAKSKDLRRRADEVLSVARKKNSGSAASISKQPEAEPDSGSISPSANVATLGLFRDRSNSRVDTENDNKPEERVTSDIANEDDEVAALAVLSSS
jgi:chromosome segregation ATPase